MTLEEIELLIDKALMDFPVTSNRNWEHNRASRAVLVLSKLKPLMYTDTRNPEAERIASRAYRELMKMQPPNWDARWINKQRGEH